MDVVPKTPRKRVPNFTADEKALLAQLIKKRPIIEAKQTDGKSVLKKKAAWSEVTEEFNCYGHVQKRDTGTLKRAWDNMKAITRKIRATENGNFSSNDGGPPDPLQPSQQEGLVTILDEVPVKCEINNSFDSDCSTNSVNKMSPVLNNSVPKSPSAYNDQSQEYEIDVNDKVLESTTSVGFFKNNTYMQQNTFQPDPARSRKPSDYIRKEAGMRIKHFETRKKIEVQILNAQLEAAEANRRAAVMEEERSKIRLEMAKIELEKLRYS